MLYIRNLPLWQNIIRDKKLTTIYIGGGTPTALDEECLSKLMNMIHELFPVEESEEFTVESGRRIVSQKKSSVF